MIAVMIRANDDDLFRGTASSNVCLLVYGTVAQSMAMASLFVWRNIREGLVARRSYQSGRDNTYRAFSFSAEGPCNSLEALSYKCNDTDRFRPTLRRDTQELRWTQKGVTSADVDEVENNTG